MTEAEKTGQNWSDGEIDLIVADYFKMLEMELAGEQFVKAHRNEALRSLIKRSKGSIEFKHQNISAVLMTLGEPWIAGYKPKMNFQMSLIDGIERRLHSGIRFELPKTHKQTILQDEDALYIEPTPIKLDVAEEAHPALSRLLRKFDPAARDQRNRALGLAGEERVVRHEHARLRQAGRDDLARAVRWVSQEDGDGAGYDILSFTTTGEERLLEVKTTLGHRTTPFFLSRNEKDFAKERADALRIFRLYDFAKSAKAFEIAPPLEDQLNLQAMNYRASFR